MNKLKVNLKLFDDAANIETIVAVSEPAYVSPVNEKFIEKLNNVLRKYTAGKKNLEAKIIENDRWYKSQHWDLIRKKAANEDPEPVTAYLFSTLANKHADAMDYYPEPNILEREEDDVEEAERLTHIVPLVIEKNNFRNTYSNAWWYKLKQGGAAYGVFWNPNIDGIGDIDIKKIDILNIYWEPGITDIQDSRYLFIITVIDDEVLYEMYPETKGRISDDKPLEIKTYVSDDNIDLSGKSLLVDCYYKKIGEDGRKIVHLTKYVDNIPLVSTEDDPETAATGLYDHGMYPVELDVLFPEEDSPMGFGYVDILKNPQMYIDKLDAIISKNALIAGKYRAMVKDNGSINEEELMDLSKDVIHVKGAVREGEDYALLQGKPLPPFIVQHRENKINEAKEIAGNNDFTRGESGGGVTAYAAIAALQEAGNKTSRDIIATSYNVYTRIIYMCIELIRQFYDESRSFRVEDGQGNANYIKYDNQGIKEQQLPPTYPGEGQMMDPNTGMMVQDPEYQPKYRKPIFDIKVKPEKASPFSREASNQRATEMFQMGFFSPQRAVEAKVALELMSFEGKEKVMKAVAENGDMFQQVQQSQMQVQQMQQQIAQLTQIIQGMNEVIKKETGKDMMGGVMQPGNNMMQQQGQGMAQGGGMNGQG